MGEQKMDGFDQWMQDQGMTEERIEAAWADASPSERTGRKQRYGDPALARVMNLMTPGGEHLGYMVRRPGQLPPVGPFSTIGEAEAQAEADRYAERKHNREAGQGVFTP